MVISKGERSVVGVVGKRERVVMEGVKPMLGKDKCVKDKREGA